MNVSKALASCLIMSCISITTTGCNKPSSQISSSISTTVKSSTPSAKAPEVYDVVCFAAHGLAVSSIRCDNNSTYKIPRDSKVTAYFEKITSVQQGSNTIVSFKSNNN
jgi:hypothetical protein